MILCFLFSDELARCRAALARLEMQPAATSKTEGKLIRLYSKSYALMTYFYALHLCRRAVHCSR